VQETDGVFTVVGRLEGLPEPAREPEAAKAARKIVVLVTSDTMGRGDDELGTALMGNFLKTLEEMGNELWRLVFLNAGIKLTAEGSSVLETLTKLENDGVTILVCGTCLTHFGLLDRKKVGQTTNMLDIVTALQAADSVITL
jgi:selenium metabolism protein YedF